jgi:hypothetical protein
MKHNRSDKRRVFLRVSDFCLRSIKLELGVASQVAQYAKQRIFSMVGTSIASTKCQTIRCNVEVDIEQHTF